MTTVYERIKALLPEQYKDAENLNKILLVFSSAFDELKAVNEDLKNILSIDDNEGAQLDLIGDIIGEKRNGREDPDYKIGLKFKIFKNTSRGFVDDIVRALKFITEADLVIYSDNPPASYTIYTNGETLPSDLHSMIDKLSAAGVSVIVYASDGEVPFIMNEIITVQDNLIDDLGDQFIDDGSNNIVVDRQTATDKLQTLFRGKGMGVVQTLDLTTDTGDVIIVDTPDGSGAILGVYDENQEIVDGGKLNLVYQA